MDINPANLTAFFQNVDATWASAYQSTDVWIDKVATTRASKSSQELYSWEQMVPTLREWVGPRLTEPLAAYFYSLLNKRFELTLSADVNMIEDDQYGVFFDKVRMAALRGKKWPDYTMYPVIQAGDSTLCYDGQNFFSKTHPINLYDPGFSVNSSTTQSNLFTSTPLTPDNLATVAQTMRTWVDEGGQPLGVKPKLLVIPPQLELTARNILNAAFIAPANVGGNTQVGANDNVLKGYMDLLVIDELGVTDATSWYVIDPTKPMKPFIWQLRKAPVLTPRVAPNDPSVFDLDQFLWGIKARGVAGYSLWWLAAKCKATA